MFYICELFYSLLSTSISLILFKSPNNALDRLLIHFIDNKIEFQKANTSNKDGDKINPTYDKWIAQGKSSERVDLGLRCSLLMPSPKSATPSKDGFLQQILSKSGPAATGEGGLQHNLGMQLVWFLKWLNIFH